MARASATRRAMPPESSCGIRRLGAAQSDGLELHQHQAAQHGLRQARMFAHRESHVLEDIQVSEQRAVLEQHAHAPAQGEQLPR